MRRSSEQAKLRRRLVRRIRKVGLKVELTSDRNHLMARRTRGRRVIAAFRVDLQTAYTRPADVATVAGIVDCSGGRMRLGLWKIVY